MPPSRPPRAHALRHPRPAHLWALMGLMACALAACSTRPPTPTALPEPPRAVPTEVVQSPEPARSENAEATDDQPPQVHEVDDPVAAVLKRMEATLRMAPADLARETTRLAAEEEAAIENPLLLAVALAQTRQAVDTARALGLVQRVLGTKGPQAKPLHPLARVLEARLLQQRRLEEQLERQSQQLRDAHRRNDQLNERLEAVRAIERSLNTRPVPASTPPASTSGGNAPRPAP